MEEGGLLVGVDIRGERGRGYKTQMTGCLEMLDSGVGTSVGAMEGAAVVVVF